MAHPSFNFVRNVNEQIMIPEGHTIEDIKKREQIIRDFYREWKKKKASHVRVKCLTFTPYAWRRFTPCGVMRCGRGLRVTHYIVRPRLTVSRLVIALR